MDDQVNYSLLKPNGKVLAVSYMCNLNVGKGT